MTDNLLDNTPSATVDYLSELTGPGKKYDRSKYASEQDMYMAIARGKYEADSYVDIIKANNDGLREEALRWKKEADTRANVDDLLDQLKRQPVNSNQTPANTEPKQPSYDPNQIQSLVSSEVQKLRASEREQDNYSLVLNKLKERHGNNYAQTLKQQAQELNLSDDRVNELARKEPALFMRTFGLDSTPRRVDPMSAPPQSTVRNETFRPQTDEVRDWSYYQKLKEKMGPAFFYDKKLATQMHNDSMALGERFNSGDFNTSDRDLMKRLDNYTYSEVRR